MRVISCLLLTSLALPASAETFPRISAVTLSTAGLAMIEAEGALEAGGLHLPVRRADIDDFLKSLRLSDPSSAVPKLTMAGPRRLEDTFAALPFPPDALSDLRGLMDAMVGTPVEVARRGNLVAGALMGTQDTPCATEGQRGCVSLSLRLEDGTLRQFLLDEATDVRFTDAADRAAVAQGLEAMRSRARAQMVDVHLSSSDPAPRDISLGWLQPAPVWKTAWRAEDGPDGVTLTGWAVIENASAQDWEEVTLTLATGAVQALEVQLYDRLDAPRRLAAPEMEPAHAPLMARGMMFEAEMDAAPVAMDDGESFSRFTLETPVSLQAGEMISLPFLSERLEEARLTLYRGGSGAEHPMIAIEFENPLPLRLPAGVVTLYEATRGHAGDAMLPELAPGAREVIEFARDTAVRVRESLSETRQVQSARIVDGVLVATEQLERRTTYRIEGAPDAARVLTLTHPLRDGWEVATEGAIPGFEDTRFAVDVPAGEIVSQDVLETRLTRSEVALLPLDLETLAYWTNRLPEPDLQQVLEDMQDLRREEARLREMLDDLRASEADLIADQARLVDLIVQLGDDSPATRTRRARVDEIDTEIEAMRTERANAQSRLSDITQAIRELLRES